MAEKFNWFRSGYELIQAKFEWNVLVPFLQNKVVDGEYLDSPLFPTPDTPNSKFNLEVQDNVEQITIYVLHHNSAEEEEDFVEPALVIMSILNKKGTKVLQQMLSSTPGHDGWVKLNLSKEEIVQSKCQQSDGSLTFCCKIFTHLKNESTSTSADPPVLAVDCTGGLSNHLDRLFNNMLLSDITLNIRGREFPAHKTILAARSEVFAAMFLYPTKEKLTNQIEIEDIEPEVFQELLRFIYTGRVQFDKMETMAAGLFIAADKYLLDDLKMKCENYMLSQMSPDYCIVLLLHGDLQNPTQPLNEAAKFFRRFPSQVRRRRMTATKRWEKMKQENLVLLCDIQQFVLCKK